MLKLIGLALFIPLAIGGEFDFTVEVRAGKYECYFQPITSEKHKKLELEYQVIDGGDLNINFMLILGADILVQDSMKTDGSHKIDLKGPGDYQFCFDNTFSYQARKVVYFEVYVTDENGNIEDLDVTQFAKNDAEFDKRAQEIGLTISDFHGYASRIKHHLNKVEFYQSSLRGYEHRDKVIMEANLYRVSMWSIITTVVMLFVALIQVYTIRSLFEENSKLGRALR